MRRALVLLLVAIVAGSALAFDFGGYLDNVSGIADSPVGVETPVVLIQSTTIALWAQQALGAMKLEGQFSYAYTPAIPVLVDLDYLTLSSTVPALETGASSVGVVLGRTTFRDPTGLIMNHTLDGVKLTATWPTSGFTVGVATTTLVQKPTNGIILSTLDVLDLSDPAKVFAAPRLLATLEYRAVDVFAGQQVFVGAVIQEDLRPAGELTPAGTEVADPTAGGAFDTQHGTIGLSGAIAPGLYHKTFYAISTGRTLTYLPDSESGTLNSYQYALILGHMAGIELNYFLPQLLNSRIRLTGLYSTGDPDADAYFDGNTAGNATAFVPLSAGGFSNVFTLQPGNSSHVGVSYSIRPLVAAGVDVLQAELGAVAYLRSTGRGPVSEPSVDPDSSGAYVGTDVNLSLIAQPFSDLRFVLAGGVFLPNAAVMSAGNENVDFQVTLQGVLRF